MGNINRKARLKKVMIVISFLWVIWLAFLAFSIPYKFIPELFPYAAPLPIFWLIWWIWNGNK
jgi:hypothetical protein